jgi:hypothetical protein
MSPPRNEVFIFANARKVRARSGCYPGRVAIQAAQRRLLRVGARLDGFGGAAERARRRRRTKLAEKRAKSLLLTAGGRLGEGQLEGETIYGQHALISFTLGFMTTVNLIGVVENGHLPRGRNLPADAYRPLTITWRASHVVRVACYYASGVPVNLRAEGAATYLTVKRTTRDDQKWLKILGTVTADEPHVAVFTISRDDTRPIEWSKGVWEVVYVAPDATLWQVIPPSAFTMAPTLNPNPP